MQNQQEQYPFRGVLGLAGMFLALTLAVGTPTGGVQQSSRESMDGRAIVAKVKGADPQIDLAVISIDSFADSGVVIMNTKSTGTASEIGLRRRAVFPVPTRRPVQTVGDVEGAVLLSTSDGSARFNRGALTGVSRT